MPSFDYLAVTMTGELCDCFETRRQGVQFILDAVSNVVSPGAIGVWQTDGRLVDLASARETPLLCAASNWLALATYAGRYVADDDGALVIDVGSTTTDIVPLRNGVPAPLGRTDIQRLMSGELVYTGVRRTPLCALMGERGAAELFATTLDVHLILGNLTEDSSDEDTADGRPATREAAFCRLARMLCSDRESSREADLVALARILADRQLEWISRGINAVVARLPSSPRAVVTAGAGAFAAQAAVKRSSLPRDIPVVCLADKIGSAASQAACAYALMTLAGEQALSKGFVRDSRPHDSSHGGEGRRQPVRPA
jgi:probable H4MPT-linked C1 transfer pathway protein